MYSVDAKYSEDCEGVFVVARREGGGDGVGEGETVLLVGRRQGH